MSEKRDFSNPADKRFRAAVRKRDGYKCRLCSSRNRLQVHHLRRFADFPELRYRPENGITLCARHHKEVNGKEENFQELFLGLNEGMTDFRVSMLMERYKKRNDQEEEE